MPNSKPKLPPKWRAYPGKAKRKIRDGLRAVPTPGTAAGRPLPGADVPWRDWLARHFPAVCTQPFGDRHARLWQWLEALAPGLRPAPRVEVWPRGGAKSTSTELGCARCCVKLSRRYALYVSETQEQADKHVAAIASLLEALGVPRGLNRYGSSKGWRRNELRTANGFSVSAYGLDAAMRGIKLDHYRPDLVIFDDIDSQDDSERTTEKKVAAITTAIVPAGSTDCAYLFVQNLVHEESIFAQLADGRADFLRDREPATVEPAVRGLITALEPTPTGINRYRITGGEATWAGQDLATCEQQINAWGLRAFLREAQHEVAGASGYFFDVSRLTTFDPRDLPELPRDLKRCRAWDLAATEGGGDHSVGVLMAVQGRIPDVKVWILDVRRGQWASDHVRDEIERTAKRDDPRTLLRLPQDPGQAGKDQAQQFARLFAPLGVRLKIVAPTGDKATRATGFAEAVNRGNVAMLKADWNYAFREELRKFRDLEPHEINDQVDDQVDAAADCFNELAGRRQWSIA